MINCLVTMCTGMSSVIYCVYEYEKRGQRERDTTKNDRMEQDRSICS